MVQWEPECNQCVDAGAHCTGVPELSCDCCTWQKWSCNTVAGGGKLVWGHKCMTTEGKAEEPVAGPSQAKKWKVVVVVLPAPVSRKAVGKHWQQHGEEQSKFAKLTLQLAEAYKAQWQGIQTLI